MDSDTNLDRRTILLTGLAVGSALFMSRTSEVVAQEGVEIKAIRESPSMSPGFPKVQLREARFQPGGKIEATEMKNPMICECSLGSLEIVQDGKTFTAETGFVWTCDKGTVEQTFNKGTTPAVMRIFDLLPA
jgi:hypothetical protein